MEWKVVGLKEVQVFTICDVCKDNAPVIKCDICGKDVCAFCRTTVHFFQKETVRGDTINFVYDRVMCQSHLPKGFKHRDGSEVVTYSVPPRQNDPGLDDRVL